MLLLEQKSFFFFKKKPVNKSQFPRLSATGIFDVKILCAMFFQFLFFVFMIQSMCKKIHSCPTYNNTKALKNHFCFVKLIRLSFGNAIHTRMDQVDRHHRILQSRHLQFSSFTGDGGGDDIKMKRNGKRGIDP